MIAKYFVQGISKLEKRIPQNGNVSLVFSVNAGKIQKMEVSQTEKYCFVNETLESENQVLTEILKQRIFNDLISEPVQYGTLKVSISVENGIITNYTLTTERSITGSLLKSQLRTQTNRGKYESNNKLAG